MLSRVVGETQKQADWNREPADHIFIFIQEAE